MGYQSRFRTYRTPREKNAHTRKTVLTLLLFAGIGGLLWVVKNRYDYWNWLKTYFY